MKTGFTILGALLVATCTLAKDAATDSSTSYYVHAGRLKHTYKCAEGVEAGDIEDGVIHADLHRGQERYLLISYSELSNPANPNGRCGGGLESYLVWLHIRGNTVLEAQSTRYESCFQDITGSAPRWSGQFCSLTFDSLEWNPDTKEHTETHSKAIFDSKAPEKGIQVTTQPAEQAK